MSYADGALGELADIVIDPGARRVTHVVVQPRDRHDLARLVPIDRPHVEVRADGSIAVDFTVAEINELERVHKSDYLRLGERPVEDPAWDVGIEAITEVPLYGSMGAGALGVGIEPIDLDPHATVSYDRVPRGMVEIRRDSGVSSSDAHHVGHVVGFVVDDRQHIAELILEHGHLWSKREISIPVGSIDRIASDEVVLSLAHDQIVR